MFVGPTITSCGNGAVLCAVQSLTLDEVKTTIHAFIASGLDYCNLLLLGVTDQQLKRLQSVQNASARLVIETRWSDHITPAYTSSAAHTLQNCNAGAPVFEWSCTTIPHR